MKVLAGLLFLIIFVAPAGAQSTTGAGSGASSASTGAGYRSGQKVPYAAGTPQSMTVAENVTPGTVIVRPPLPKKNTSQSPTASEAADPGTKGPKANGTPAKRPKARLSGHS